MPMLLRIFMPDTPTATPTAPAAAGGRVAGGGVELHLQAPHLALVVRPHIRQLLLELLRGQAVG